jgi:hypothetical protein
MNDLNQTIQESIGGNNNLLSKIFLLWSGKYASVIFALFSGAFKTTLKKIISLK